VIGYSAAKEVDRIERENLLQYIAPQDLKSFGLIPEIIGRLPVLVHLDPLNKGALRRILTEPKNSVIKQYKKLFKIDKIELEFEEEALEYIVEKAIEFKLGARGLRSICESIMNDAMYEMPSEKTEYLVITQEYAQNKMDRSSIRRLKAS
jgi:ATP-dependent Clp protease ATP-binding subunit ClpX